MGIVNGGGGSMPYRALYSGNAVAVGASLLVPLTFDSKDLGNDLLDLTDPANPVVITAGRYTLTVTSGCDADLTDQAWYLLFVQMDVNGDDAQAYTNSVRAGVAPEARPRACISNTYYVPAGGVIQAAVVNHDSVQRGFFINNAVLQYLG